MSKTLPNDTLRNREIEALLGTLCPATLAAVPVMAYQQVSAYPWVIAGAVSLVLCLSAVYYARYSVICRIGASLALLTWTGGNLLEHLANPFRGLFIMLSTVCLLAYVWPSEKLRRFNIRVQSHRQKRDILIATLLAIFVGLDQWLLFLGDVPRVQSLALTGTYLTPILFWGRYRKHRRLAKSSIQLMLVLIALVPAFSHFLTAYFLVVNLTPIGVLSPLILFLIIVRQFVSSPRIPGQAFTEPSILDEILVHPSRVMVISFLSICALGTLFLGLPIAAPNDRPHAWLDAAFTSVSATCVTGLAVLDTPTAFTPFGQLVILILIQVGGLGIMVFSAAAISLLGRRLSLSHERVAMDLVGANNRASLNQSIRTILWVTLVTEALAAILLTLCFWGEGDALPTAIWRGCFTAISAFCNAGFALQSDSLVGYAHNPSILLIVAVTIIVGGLGPLVVISTLDFNRKQRRNLHVRLVLWSSALLIVMPGLFITLVEWRGTLAELDILGKVSNGFFQSVTLRTAGFNSIDLAAIHPSVWTLMMILMFIGGSPASTAGGIKTTTVAVILIAVVSIVKGQERIEVFGRTLPNLTVIRATVVATLALVGAGLALTTLQLTQMISLEHAAFEVVSALATVGLSQGATAQLDEIGKLIIIICMFAGRVGPLTLFVFLSSNSQKKPNRQLPEEPIPIG